MAQHQWTSSLAMLALVQWAGQLEARLNEQDRCANIETKSDTKAVPTHSIDATVVDWRSLCTCLHTGWLIKWNPSIPNDWSERMMECVPVVRAMSQLALFFHYWKSRSQVNKRVLMKGLSLEPALFFIDDIICGPLAKSAAHARYLFANILNTNPIFTISVCSGE